MLDLSNLEGLIGPSSALRAAIAQKYRIERVVGRGGMGVVLLARNILLDERVAIKVLARHPTPCMTERLVMEARATARLKSDHVVRVFDVGTTETGSAYIVMEYLDGQPLSERMREPVAIPITTMVKWLIEACEGVAAAHRHGIVHRDLKPANLFVEQCIDLSCRIKVLDFGISKLPMTEALGLTTHPVGSPLYMSPEQLGNSQQVDARTDIWGIGVVLYELLTGKTPFVARSMLDLALQLRDAPHVPVQASRPDVPEALSNIVDRCLEKKPVDRWANVAELALALARFGAPGAGAAATRVERILFARRADVSLSWSSEEAQSSGTPVERRQLPGDRQVNLTTMVTSIASVPVPGRAGMRGSTRIAVAALVLAPGFALGVGMAKHADVLTRRTGEAPASSLRPADRDRAERPPAPAERPASMASALERADAALPPGVEARTFPAAVDNRQTDAKPSWSARGERGSNATRERTSASRPARSDGARREAASAAAPVPASDPTLAQATAGPLPIDRDVAW